MVALDSSPASSEGVREGTEDATSLSLTHSQLDESQVSQSVDPVSKTAPVNSMLITVQKNCVWFADSESKQLGICVLFSY